MADEVKDLELRLRRLEETVGTLPRKSAQGELSEEDVKAYHRVREALFTDGMCGINETSPCVISCVHQCIVSCVHQCIVSCVHQCIHVCDFECSCGPCGFGMGRFGGGGRFGRLGG